MTPAEKRSPADFGLNVGDLVTFDSDDDNAGGIVYRIVMDNPPVVPHTTKREITKTDRSNKQYKVVEHGSWDEKGRSIKPCDVRGYVRIKPFYSFYATNLGKNPKGAKETIMIYYGHGMSNLKKVDIVDLGAKYVELGELIRSLVKERSDEG